METDAVSDMLISLFFKNTGRWTKSKNPEIISIIHHHQNPSE
jgi:hypothetical protein